MSEASTNRKTPKDATEFEREQLRHLLTTDDLAATLFEINPSLAWLPVLGEMNLIRSGDQLAPWVGRNFTESDAIKDVAANIRFFNTEAAEILEIELNKQADALPPLQLRCWRLIIRSLRESGRGGFSEWFELVPRIKRRDFSREVVDRLADLLRPKLVIGGRADWYRDSSSSEPTRPSDLMSLDYEISDLANEDEVLSTWPEDAPADEDARLLSALTDNLDRALADATEAGVEADGGYSASDSDVPSVADHPQNEYHNGFIVIVRVMADLWTRLATKNVRLALVSVNRWYRSDFKLSRRLALFAGGNEAVEASTVFEILMALPMADWFLANSSVEVYRLLRMRWADLSADQRVQIEDRIAAGPPTDRFREGADVSEIIDRYRFDLLGDLQRRGLELSESAAALLTEISARHPQWILRSAEEAGFHVWVGDVRSVEGDPEALDGVADGDLVDRAAALQAEDAFDRGNVWGALCRSDPKRALRGLAAKGDVSQWPVVAWQSFLWSAPKLVDPSEVAAIADLLLRMPEESLTQITSVASFWVNEKSRDIENDALWILWDRIFAISTTGAEEKLTMRDVFTDALNAPGGRLAEVVIKKIVKTHSYLELPESVISRLDKLVRAEKQFGTLARVRLAADVAFLFENAPSWTAENIVPLFRWSSPNALEAWSARKYSRYIGSPQLNELLKEPFLELFGRDGVPNEDIRVYAGWLAAMLLAIQSGAVNFPITATEARSALRKSGAKSLSSFGHRLAVEMEAAADGDKIARWKNVVGPVFENVWPLDAELQSSASTFKLVQILTESGAAFPDAAEIIIPFVRPEKAGAHTTVFNISRAAEIIYQSSPERVLDLLDVVVGDAAVRSVHGLNQALERLKTIKPMLANTKKFQHLVHAASVY